MNLRLLWLLPGLLIAAGTARAETVAVLQGLDKTTARISKFDAPVGKSVRFGTLVITVRACIKHPPEEEPESAAFLQIEEVAPGRAQLRRVAASVQRLDVRVEPGAVGVGESDLRRRRARLQDRHDQRAGERLARQIDLERQRRRQTAMILRA